MRHAAIPPIRAAVAFAVFALAAGATHAFAGDSPGFSARKIWTFTFESDTLGQAPPHTVVRGGDWAVEADSTAPSGRVLRQRNDDDGVAWHYIQLTRPSLEDVAVSVRFRIDSGEIDPSAGVLFQLDPKARSGYLVRLSGKTHEIAFHYLLLGKRRDLRFTKIDWPEPGTWHTLAVRRAGDRLAVLYDGREVMRARDERYRKGTIGLWTENDSVVDFADLEVGVP
jgi:hypothetical protein